MQRQNISKVGERCVEEKFAPFKGRYKLRGSYTRPSSFNQKIISLLQINIDFARFKFDRFCLRADRPALLLKSTKLNGADQDKKKGKHVEKENEIENKKRLNNIPVVQYVRKCSHCVIT